MEIIYNNTNVKLNMGDNINMLILGYVLILPKLYADTGLSINLT